MTQFERPAGKPQLVHTAFLDARPVQVWRFPDGQRGIRVVDDGEWLDYRSDPAARDLVALVDIEFEGNGALADRATGVAAGRSGHPGRY